MNQINQIQFKMRGTEQQAAQFQDNCTRTEALFALTLMKRFDIAQTDENHGLVMGWLKSARDMGIANFISSGLQAQLVNDGQPTVVCLCGSTKFVDEFRAANLRETIAGRIVLSIGCDTKSDADLQALGELTDEAKAKLDELHKRKIDMADEILVLNVGGYIGESTRSEIAYAIKNLKRIRWLEDPAPELAKEFGIA